LCLLGVGGEQERREIERALLEGDLWAVCATNALELGVDVGSLDVTLHLGFPGTVASLWQQVCTLFGCSMLPGPTWEGLMM
jgi:ATP-dependent helicase YprA (DUF1998 family)